MNDMNDPTLNMNVPPPGEATLTPEGQALLDQFLSPPPCERLLYLWVLHHFGQAPAKRRALALKLLNAGLSAKDVARLSGVSPRQLRRYAEYRIADRLLGGPSGPPPRGAKGRDGELEAWDGEA